jgi:hypothetical protein
MALFSSRSSSEFHVSETQEIQALFAVMILDLFEVVVSLVVDIVLVEIRNLFSEYHVLCR